jgi:hypothetical protein
MPRPKAGNREEDRGMAPCPGAMVPLEAALVGGALGASTSNPNVCTG